MKQNKNKSNPTAKQLSWATRLMLQGWLSIALWMSVGLLLEGLLGYKIPTYLNDLDRRELFRLAHTHGTFLGLVLIAASLSERRGAKLPRIASMALSIGAALMPLGFFLAGLWHPEGDPGPAIWIVPPSALLIIFGAVSLALAHTRKNAPPD
jgi:hypothetical protein